jgi:peptidyl-prolyl cis-trans isomerase B (cyclophilin B)
MAERAEASRRRRRLQATIGAGVAVLVVVGAVVWAVAANRDDDKPTAAASPSASAQPKPCIWNPLVDPKASPKPTLPPEVKEVGTPPTNPPRTGRQTMTITSNLGVIKIEMDTEKAPCASASFTFLAAKKFFDNSSCHRLVTEGIRVLQCGDPTGTGSGGPSYRYQEENLPIGRRPAYPAGTVAIAKAQDPATSGAQFFILYEDVDQELTDQQTGQPGYAVLGRVTEGMDIVRKIAAGGHDGAFEPAPGGGHPKSPLKFVTVTVSDPA